MCGITGIFLGRDSDTSLLNAVTEMSDKLLHRGPDDSGIWVEERFGLALGHRRLAILDPSPAGHQPMHSVCGRFVLAFNGEIYNHMLLRAELRTAGLEPVWRGHSDTETLLASIAAWGLEQTLKRCRGMFAISLWDHHRQTLTLARDRIGEKPLYYGWTGQGQEAAFVFASELKALKAYPSFAPPVCRQSLAQYMRFMYVPAPRSIYQGVFKLEPGCLLKVVAAPPPTPPVDPLRAGQDFGSVSVRRWWSLSTAVEAGAAEPLEDETQALKLLEGSLEEAVRLQCLADVPLGAFLSGGVDSSTIVALMQKQSSRPVKTFTIGFDEADFDESPHALAVARHLGTEHQEMRVTAEMAQAVIPELPHMYDEPFSDSSQIPMYLVCKVARQKVTVALSGDAGDELFGGYSRYFWGPRIWNRLAWMPPGVKQALGGAINCLPAGGWDALSRPLNAMLPVGKDITRVGDKAQKLALQLQSMKNFDDLYINLVSQWHDPAYVVRATSNVPAHAPANMLDDDLPAQGLGGGPLRMMYRDSMTYLPDDILCKVDRAAMAVSLETRVPFLDHRVVELAWRLPLHMKIRGNEGKWALRQVLYKYVPRELIERPKAGFAIPVGEWLRGPLRDWADALLTTERLKQEGYFHPEPIQLAWKQHLSGRFDWTARLWTVLMFQSWLEVQE